MTGSTAQRALGAAVREDFPILDLPVRGQRLVYLDNAATTQRPKVVIDAVTRFYTEENANIHRGVHHLSEVASAKYEATRESARAFLNAQRTHEIVFPRGTTEAVNIVAHGFGESVLKPGDEVLVSEMEHHSNLVPWQRACARSRATLVTIPLTPSAELDLEAMERLLSSRTRLVAITWVSNATGVVNPVQRIVELAHAHGAAVFIDGAQAAPHLPVDVQALDCDFFACSGHKMLGPTGVGILYGKESWLDRLPPYQTGGGMIDMVTMQESSWARLPAKFEAGTPDIAAVVAFDAALGYLRDLGMHSIAAHETELVTLAVSRLRAIAGIAVVAEPRERAAVVSFTVAGVHPHDVGTVLDQSGIAIRAGHHCCQPLMRHLKVPATARASFSVYNTLEDVDALVAALANVRAIFG